MFSIFCIILTCSIAAVWKMANSRGVWNESWRYRDVKDLATLEPGKKTDRTRVIEDSLSLPRDFALGVLQRLSAFDLAWHSNYSGTFQCRYHHLDNSFKINTSLFTLFLNLPKRSSLNLCLMSFNVTFGNC